MGERSAGRLPRALAAALALGLALTLGLGGAASAAAGPPPLRVGSKKYTESVILGELVAQLAAGAGAGARVEHRRELGGTRVLWDALLAGEIDVYPEYTGTISEEL
ncbi:MAG: glycine betaine ABC transporter substrate-binding protein, partial [Anaeromyxobacteraceae bacterium]